MIDKAFISFRISTSLWMDKQSFDNLLSLFAGFPEITDDIVLFTADTHAPLPLEMIRARANILIDRMNTIRNRGYGAGVNILSTIGHHEENLTHSLSGDYTRMTNIHSKVSQGVLCPNDEQARDYIKQLYEIIVSTGPDYIWIDDDIRFGHMPIENGCFCDKCLAIFEEESGIRFDRDLLSKSFNHEPLEEQNKIRKLWLQHNRNTIDRLLKLIEETVHAIKPDMPLGFMTGDRFFEGYDFDRWAKTLAGLSNNAVYWRPGGGFYSDDRMSELAGKSQDIGRQIAFLPPEVTRIQSEIENFPYQALRKSASVTALEAASHMAAGCTGAAFNVLTSSGSDAQLHQYKPIIERIAEARPFYDLLASMLDRSAPVGIYTGWNKDSFITGNGDWLTCDHQGMAGSNAVELLELGLPAAYSLDSAQVTVLTGDSTLSMDEQTILKILSSGVYMDGQALECLNRLGYGHLTGFDIDGYITKDGIEELVEHPLNKNLNGSMRDCRQSFLFWLRPAAKLIPGNDSCGVLARIVDYSGSELSPCCQGIYENSLGGRVCVGGYYPWTFLQNYSKSMQIKAVMRWLSKDSLQAYVSSYHKVNLWARGTQSGKQAVVFTNSSNDRAEELSIMLHTSEELISLFDMTCEESIIPASNTIGDYKEFILPPVRPWQMRLLVAGIA